MYLFTFHPPCAAMFFAHMSSVGREFEFTGLITIPPYVLMYGEIFWRRPRLPIADQSKGPGSEKGAGSEKGPGSKKGAGSEKGAGTMK